MKIKKFKVNPLSEIFQSLDVKFAFVNKKGDEASCPAKCRDFLGDCLWSRATGKDVSIYKFKYSFKETPYDVDTLRLSLHFPDDKTKELFIKNIIKLRLIEESIGIKDTKIFATQYKNILVIEADKVWQSAIWKLSLYTFICKVCCYNHEENIGQPESRYYSEYLKNKELLFSKLLDKTNDYWYDDIGSTHDMSGFFNLCTRTSHLYYKEVFPQEETPCAA